MRRSVRDIWVAFNRPIEARLDFMYLDSEGWVTTALGNKIDETRKGGRTPTDAERRASLSLAMEWSWENERHERATPEEVAAEWDRTKARFDQRKDGGGSFEQYATLRLPDAAIDTVMFRKLDSTEHALKARAEFTHFDSMPADAQLGLLSMAWAMGVARFEIFKIFRAAVADGHWTDAAKECRISPDTGTLKVRNDRNQQLFRNTGLVIAEGRDPDILIWTNPT
ncbi:hypothetical protein [Streptomyces purpurogeneiscleroticus]|uniref:hypothetical protein n=1 Tax=Streptomyces purpurogeneiscleroticus TaxID=68259 RepID=UPI001CBF864B|nr:hypothetical protein [Streptomyces purpurogeneiscleroticus]MBZ4018031.1 hypothetical protein [Streptomyces purpurogeneiscleroticus]